MPAKFKVGDRVRVALKDKNWIGPAVDKLDGQLGTVTQVDEQSAAAEVFGFGHEVKLDEPVDLGARSITSFWFIEDYLERAS